MSPKQRGKDESHSINNNLLDEFDQPLTLEDYNKIDSAEIVGDRTRQIEFPDAFQLGRTLNALRVKLMIAKFGWLTEEGKKSGMFDVKYILSDILSVELRLYLLNVCPQIRVQMKQQRQKIAKRYLRMEEEKESNEVDGEGDNTGKEGGNLLFEEPHMIREVTAVRLEDNVVDWLYILTKELEKIYGFAPSHNSRLDVVQLLDQPGSFFDKKIWDWLDEQPQNDFEEACECLAFESPTACVMLLLRCVEYTLREWYEQDTGRKIEQRTWGQVIGELEDIYDTVENRPPVLSNLDYLKDRRNSISHPDDSSTQREAERMLYRVEGTITEIYNQMP